MKHLERALDGQNQFWKYLLTFFASLLAGNIIGSIPLFVLITYKTMTSGGAISPNPDNMADLTAYGISGNLSLILLMLPMVTGLLVAVLLLKPLHKRSFTEVVNGTKIFRWNRFFVGFAVWFVLYALYFGISYLLNPEIYVLQLQWESFIPLIVISLLIIPFQTAFEELLFRGYLAQGLAAWTKNRWLVILVPSVLFGLLHSANPEVKEFGFWLAIPQYVFFGMIFGLISILDDGIESAIGIHASNNIFASIFITHKASVLQTPAAFEQTVVDPYQETIALVIMGIILTFILYKIYKWDARILYQKVSSPEELS